MPIKRLNDLPLVLCVCRHNSGRSQMAVAYLRGLLAGRANVMSAGTDPADHVDPKVVLVMHEDGYDISHATPIQLYPKTIAGADYVITMNCDVTTVPRIDEDWDLPDPRNQSHDQVRSIRDLVKAKAQEFARRFPDLHLTERFR